MAKSNKTKKSKLWAPDDNGYFDSLESEDRRSMIAPQHWHWDDPHSGLWFVGRTPREVLIPDERKAEVRRLTKILEALDFWLYYAVRYGTCSYAGSFKSPELYARFRTFSNLLAAALGYYLPGANIYSFSRVCESAMRINLAEEPSAVAQDAGISVDYWAAWGTLERLRIVVLDQLSQLAPARGAWEEKLAQWSKTVPTGFVRIVRRVVDWIEQSMRPLTQAELAHHFGNDESQVKHPLARATAFGLFDKFRTPKGYWPSYLEASPSWVRSAHKKQESDH